MGGTNVLGERLRRRDGRRNTRRNERGAAAVETALCICFVVLPLVFATIAYAYMFSFRQALSQAASEGARSTVGAPAGDITTTAQQAVHDALSTYGMSCNGGGAHPLTCAVCMTSDATCMNNAKIPATTCPGSHSCVAVKVDYPYRDHTLLPTVPGFGFTLTGSLSFTSVVQVS